MKTPLEILLSVEDHIDHPAHTINERLAKKALDSLDQEGWAIERKRTLLDEPMSEIARFCQKYYGNFTREEIGNVREALDAAGLKIVEK